MMKRFLLTVLAAILLFAVLGCDKEPPPDEPPPFVPYIVTFHPNNNDEGSTQPNPLTQTITEEKNTVDLPTEPTRPYFEFVQWNLKEDGTGDEFTATTPVTAGMVNSGTTRVIVYAKWRFLGGEVKVEGDTLVHNYPQLTASTSGHGTFAGSINDDGSVTISGGAFRYLFPTTGTDSNSASYNIADYTYFKIDYSLISFTPDPTAPAGNQNRSSGCIIKQYNSATDYGGISNIYPWWSNSDNRTQEFPLSGAGASGGIAFQFNGTKADAEAGTPAVPYTITILSITFYKVDLRTVTFDLDGGTGTAPNKSVRDGASLGTDMPADPTRAGYYFIGWFDGDTLVTTVTPITKDTDLKAGWTDTEPEKVEFINVPNGGSGVPIYRFTMPPSKTWKDIKAMTFTVMVLDETSYNMTAQGRAHIVGNYAESNFNTTTGAFAVSDWGNNRMVMISDRADIAYILNNAEGTSGQNLRGQWVTFTISLDPTDGKINTSWPSGTANSATKPADDATGPFFLGVGLTGADKALPAYYQKDVALVMDDDSEVNPDAFDTVLSGSLTLGKLYFTAESAKPVTRSMVYEPEELEDE